VLGKVTLLAGFTTPFSTGVPDVNHVLKTAAVTVHVGFASGGIVCANADARLAIASAAKIGTGASHPIRPEGMVLVVCRGQPARTEVAICAVVSPAIWAGRAKCDVDICTLSGKEFPVASAICGENVATDTFRNLIHQERFGSSGRIRTYNPSVNSRATSSKHSRLAYCQRSHTLRYLAKGSQFSRLWAKHFSRANSLSIALHFATDYKDFEGESPQKLPTVTPQHDLRVMYWKTRPNEEDG